MDMLEIPNDERASHDIVLKILNKMENLNITVFEEDPKLKRIKLLTSRAKQMIEHGSQMGIADQVLHVSQNKRLQGFKPKEEIKDPYNRGNYSEEYLSENSISVSDMEDEKDELAANSNVLKTKSTTLYSHLIGCFTEHYKKNKNRNMESKVYEISLNDLNYLLRNKPIKWNNSDTLMHVFQESYKSSEESSYLANTNSRMILKQFANELKNLLDSMINELGTNENINSLESISGMIEELLLMISVNDSDSINVEKESFNIKDLCDEVYNILANKIDEKKIDYIRTFAPELENVNISSKRTIIKQILLSIFTNAILNTERGQIKLE